MVPALLSLSSGMVLATLAACVTTTASAAPRSAALAILLGGAILPNACLVAAAKR